MSKPLAVVVGFIGKFPVAGMSLYNIHYIVGLQDLGYEVHYVERQNRETECYDPRTNEITDDPSYALDYIRRVLPRYQISSDRFSYIDRENICHGSGWSKLRSALEEAIFVLTLADETWFDDLGRCENRAFIDGDPMLTQVAMIEEEPVMSSALSNYDVLFTYGTRMGQAGCAIPSAGRTWMATRPVVATRLWDPTPASDPVLPLTTVMHWGGGRHIEYDGVVYGHKGQEFLRFQTLPQLTSQQFSLALGGTAPRQDITSFGWKLVNPLEKTGTLEAYERFISESRADFGIAKNIYVASQSGWFSDRSTCYLASGRPVLHQETGFTDRLPVGEGVFSFTTVDDVLAALTELDKNYEIHTKAARRIAEEYFEARTVIGNMLDAAGFR